ncbi:MAG: class I adenylate-forming enzyme family protein [Luteitalea sp.]
MTSPSLIADAFAAVVRDRADEVLLEAPSNRCACTARQIDDRAQQFATAFTRSRLAAGHVVLAAIGNHPSMPSLVLACLRGALPLLPVDHSAPVAEVLALARRWRAAVLIVPDTMPLPAGAGTAHRLADGLTGWLPDPRPEPGAHGTACLLKLTSGSTGAPRATATEEHHLVADVRQIVASMDIGPQTRQLAVIPLSHSYGFSNLLLPLLWQGTPLRLRPQFVPTQIAGDVADGAIETLAGVPFMFDHLARHQAAPLGPTLRLVLSAGARLSFETVQAFHRATGLKVRSFYGSSETGGICFDDSAALDPAVPVGRPLAHTVVQLLPDDQAPSGSGRLAVLGPAVIERYAADGSTEPAPGGQFVTGDYGYQDAGGRFVLTGRTASFVNVAGRKVQPQDVEAALRALPAIADAVVMAVHDEVRGEALGACLASARPWTGRQVREALSARLAPHKLPRVVVVLPELPVTARGKIDRAAVARLLDDAQR